MLPGKGGVVLDCEEGSICAHGSHAIIRGQSRCVCGGASREDWVEPRNLDELLSELVAALNDLTKCLESIRLSNAEIVSNLWLVSRGSVLHYISDDEKTANILADQLRRTEEESIEVHSFPMTQRIDK